MLTFIFSFKDYEIQDNSKFLRACMNTPFWMETNFLFHPQKKMSLESKKKNIKRHVREILTTKFSLIKENVVFTLPLEARDSLVSWEVYFSTKNNPPLLNRVESVTQSEVMDSFKIFSRSTKRDMMEYFVGGRH